MRFLEEFHPGDVIELGSHTFERDAIVAFARDFDPQPFHLDEEAGRRSLFGGLAASGWHVASAWMALWIGEQNRVLAERATTGGPQPIPGPSPGFDDMRWLKPVRPGDTVTYRSIVVTARPSASRSGWGILTARNEGLDAAGVCIFHFTGHILMPRLPADAAAATQA